jgi:hypothetical protein
MTKIQSRTMMATLLFLTLPHAAPALAGDPPAEPKPPSTAEAEDGAMSDAAQELFEKGMKGWDARKWDECRTALIDAWAIQKQPQIAAKLGACELKLGLYRDAAEHLDFFLREAPETLPGAQRAEVQVRYLEAEREVARLKITTDPPDAEVIVDGKSIGRGPRTTWLFLDAGPHVIELRAEGWRPRRELFAGFAGMPDVITTMMDPMDATVAPVPVETKAPVEKKAPKKAAAPAPPEKQSKWPRPMPVPVMVVGGIGIAAVITGAVLLGVAGSDRSGAEELAGDIQSKGKNCVVGKASYDGRCPILDGGTTASDLKHDVGVGVIVGGAAIAAGAAVWWLFPPPSAAAPAASDGATKKTSLRVRAVPEVGTSGGGVTVLGSF